LDAVVRSCERLCGLPAVATLDWTDRAARALSVLLAPSRVCVMIVQTEPSGRVSSLEAAGSGACLSREQALAPARSSWTDGESEEGGGGVDLAIRSRADRVRELGFRLDGLKPRGVIVGSAARLAGSELWRTSAVGAAWVGTDVSDVLIGVAALGESATSRCVVVQIGLIGHGANGPRRVAIEHQAALETLLPLLVRRVQLALGTVPSTESTWLTVREQQVLEHLVLGKSVRQIADDLGRSPHTVHDHVKSLHRKLGASSRGELIARALGYIEEGARIRDDEPRGASMAEPKLTVADEGDLPEIVTRPAEPLRATRPTSS
jgi:DNA-binding CsgD family transcriptional regulator